MALLRKQSLAQLWDSTRQLEPSKRDKAISDGMAAALSNWHVAYIRSPDSAIIPCGTHIRIGVAPYVLAELLLLDRMERLLSDGEVCMERVEVFDLLHVGSIEDMPRYIPGVGAPRQTPVYGRWVDGVLKESDWGWRAQKRLDSLFPFKGVSA
jgi:hypothetical protein